MSAVPVAFDTDDAVWPNQSPFSPRRNEKYTTVQARDHGIQVVICEAPEARVEDLTR